MPLAGVACESLWPHVPFWVLGCAISIGAFQAYLIHLHLSARAVHQGALSHTLTDWVLHAPRTSLVTANKEGLASFPGAWQRRRLRVAPD
jgi:hypothetical protein